MCNAAAWSMASDEVLSNRNWATWDGFVAATASLRKRRPVTLDDAVASGEIQLFRVTKLTKLTRPCSHFFQGNGPRRLVPAMRTWRSGE